MSVALSSVRSFLLPLVVVGARGVDIYDTTGTRIDMVVLGLNAVGIKHDARNRKRIPECQTDDGSASACMDDDTSTT